MHIHTDTHLFLLSIKLCSADVFVRNMCSLAATVHYKLYNVSITYSKLSRIRTHTHIHTHTHTRTHTHIHTYTHAHTHTLTQTKHTNT